MMVGSEEYVNERLDHLGIVAGVCQEIGLAAWLDAQDPENRQQVSVGTATVAMVLNGLGFSNRQLYLVPQFFANKPIEHLLEPGITAEMLNDDCLGRTLDWLYTHDLTKLFAGIASSARRLFGIKAMQIHVDTTSFSVSGEYAQEVDADSPSDTAVIAVTYGYSRDHRQDLKQWMLALATTHEGDIPLFMQPLDGNGERQLPPGRAGSLAQGVLDCRHECPGPTDSFRPSSHRYLQRPEGCGAWVSLSQRSALSSILRLCQKTGAHHGPQLHHGPLPVGVSLG